MPISEALYSKACVDKHNLVALGCRSHIGQLVSEYGQVDGKSMITRSKARFW